MYGDDHNCGNQHPLVRYGYGYLGYRVKTPIAISFWGLKKALINGGAPPCTKNTILSHEIWKIEIDTAHE